MRLAILCLVFLPQVALAQSGDRQRAKSFFDAGSLAYDRGRYAEAARAFEEAYRVLADPAIAFSLAQAHRRQYFVDQDPARLGRAIELYRVYLERDARGTRRPEAVEQIQVLLPLSQAAAPIDPQASAIREPPATELMLYSEAPGAVGAIDQAPSTALPLVVPVAPGVHRVSVEAPGYQARVVEARAIEGRLTPVPVELTERPARVVLATEDGARVFIDGELRGIAPFSAPIELASGAHRLTLLEAGTEGHSMQLVLERDQLLQLDVPLPTTTARRLAYYAFGGGAAFVAAGGVTAILASLAESNAIGYEEDRGVRNLDSDELGELNSSVGRRDAFRGASIALFTTAIITGAIGVILYFADDPEVAEVERRTSPAN
jgi:tetratricopeptide (TPR) repeat protein